MRSKSASPARSTTSHKTEQAPVKLQRTMSAVHRDIKELVSPVSPTGHVHEKVIISYQSPYKRIQVVSHVKAKQSAQHKRRQAGLAVLKRLQVNQVKKLGDKVAGQLKTPVVKAAPKA